MKAGELPKQDRFVANEKSAFPKLAEVFRSTPLSTWQAYLRFHYLHAFAPYLTTELADANFAFFGTVLNNQPAQLPRATRAVRLVSSQVGEAIGRLYVEKYFPPSSKAQMEALVANLRAALEDRIRKLDWMSDATKTAALVKLSQFTVKIGYPNKWIDYGPLTVAPNDLLGNVQRARRVPVAPRSSRSCREPVDREEWGMTPQTVNAYYNPNLNEIVFPAAILQPPFFDPNADPAVNYGGIGAVIGHEIGHGFDDQGSKFDGKGVLRGWWTDADREPVRGAYEAARGRVREVRAAARHQGQRPSSRSARTSATSAESRWRTTPIIVRSAANARRRSTASAAISVSSSRSRRSGASRCARATCVTRCSRIRTARRSFA